MTPRRLLLLFGLGLAALIVGKVYFSDEAVLRRELRAAARNFEQERILALASFVAADYRDERGLGRQELLGLAHEAFGSYEQLSLSLRIGTIQLSGGKASVAVEFNVSGELDGQRGRIAGSRLDPVRALLRLERRGGDWKLVATEQVVLPGGAQPQG